MAFDAEALAMYYGDKLALRQAAENEQAMAARRSLCRALVTAFEATGQALRVGGHLLGSGRVDGSSPFGNGDDGMVALGYLSSTCASLISGAVELLTEGNCYAASSLNRQLVELEYLGWAFAEDHAEAASWLRSSRQDRLNRWQPRHLRDRSNGRFRGTDYAEHCEIGGHPTPKGVRILSMDNAPRVTELLFSETATHGLSSWKYLRVAISRLSDNDQGENWLIPPDLDTTVETAATDWKSHDHLADTWITLSRNV